MENLSPELTSDHTPILVDILAKASQMPPLKPPMITNWEKFTEQMEKTQKLQSKLTTKSLIYTEIFNLTSNLQKAFNENSSTFSPTDPKRDLPRAIEKEIQIKRRLRSLWQRTRNPDVKTTLNRQTTKTKEILQYYPKEQWA